MTYGVASIGIAALVAHRRREGRTATVTAVRPPARFGTLALDAVTGFTAKAAGPKAGSSCWNPA